MSKLFFQDIFTKTIEQNSKRKKEIEKSRISFLSKISRKMRKSVQKCFSRFSKKNWTVYIFKTFSDWNWDSTPSQNVWFTIEIASGRSKSALLWPHFVGNLGEWIGFFAFYTLKKWSLRYISHEQLLAKMSKTPGNVCVISLLTKHNVRIYHCLEIAKLRSPSQKPHYLLCSFSHYSRGYCEAITLRKKQNKTGRKINKTIREWKKCVILSKRRGQARAHAHTHKRKFIIFEMWNMTIYDYYYYGKL